MSSNATWRKSSHSAPESACVELSVASTHAGIRDTKNRTSGELWFTDQNYRTFLYQLKLGLTGR